MIEHSCCCICNFVMSGLNKIQIGFENLLKNGFEKLEKEKGKEILFFSGRFLSRSPSPRPAAAARFSFSLSPRPPPVPLGRAQAVANGPASRARGRLPPEPLTCRSHRSASVLLSFSFLRHLPKMDATAFLSLPDTEIESFSNLPPFLT
jgi:hypothetical protein